MPAGPSAHSDPVRYRTWVYSRCSFLLTLEIQKSAMQNEFLRSKLKERCRNVKWGWHFCLFIMFFKHNKHSVNCMKYKAVKLLHLFLLPKLLGLTPPHLYLLSTRCICPSPVPLSLYSSELQREKMRHMLFLSTVSLKWLSQPVPKQVKAKGWELHWGVTCG